MNLATDSRMPTLEVPTVSPPSNNLESKSCRSKHTRESAIPCKTMLPPPSKRSRRGAAQRRVLAYMDALPCAAQYETSYAHRAVVTHTVVLARAHIKNIREK